MSEDCSRPFEGWPDVSVGTFYGGLLRVLSPPATRSVQTFPLLLVIQTADFQDNFVTMGMVGYLRGGKNPHLSKVTFSFLFTKLFIGKHVVKITEKLRGEQG